MKDLIVSDKVNWLTEGEKSVKLKQSPKHRQIMLLLLLQNQREWRKPVDLFSAKLISQQIPRLLAARLPFAKCHFESYHLSDCICEFC